MSALRVLAAWEQRQAAESSFAEALPAQRGQGHLLAQALARQALAQQAGLHVPSAQGKSASRAVLRALLLHGRGRRLSSHGAAA